MADNTTDSLVMRPVSWEEIERLVGLLVTQIKSHNRRIDHILAIEKGGLIPASLLRLAFPEAGFSTVRCTSYTAPGQKNKEVSVRSMYSFYGFNDPKTLVVDEICDSGATFAAIQGYVPKATYASLYVREGSEFVPEFWTHAEPDGTWLVFPWDKFEEKVPILD